MSRIPATWREAVEMTEACLAPEQREWLASLFMEGRLWRREHDAFLADADGVQWVERGCAGMWDFILGSGEICPMACLRDMTPSRYRPGVEDDGPEADAFLHLYYSLPDCFGTTPDEWRLGHV